MREGAAYSIDGVVVRHRNWATLGKIGAASAALFALAALAESLVPALVGFYALVLGNLLFWLGRNQQSRLLMTRTEGFVEVDDRGLSLNTKRLASRDDITGGNVVHRIGANSVARIERRARRDIELEMPTEAAAHDLLRALGIDRSQRVAHFATASRLFASLPAFFLMILAMVASYASAQRPFGGQPLHGWALLAPLAVLATYLSASSLFRTHVTVGADGVTLKEPFAKERFIAFAEIAEIDTEVGHLDISLVSDETVKLHLPLAGGRGAQERMAALAEAIRDGKKASGGARDANVEARLEAERGDVGRWIASLRAIGTGADADHRRAAIDGAELWRIALDPNARPAARAGAAVALADGLDEEGRARLRDAARTTASPKIRVAIETAAASPSDEALSDALAELEAEPEERSTARAR